MKTNLLPGFCLIKAFVLFSSLFLMNTLSFAQTKRYANSQINQISGICIGCSILDPQNAAGNNENNCSTLKIGVGVAGKVEQTLLFPEPITGKKIVIGIGTSNSPLSVALLNGVSIETLNGNTSNNDSQIIDFSLIKLGSQVNKATFELIPSQSFNRVKISLNGGLLNLGGELQIYYAYVTEITNRCLPVPNPIHYYSFDGNTQDNIPGSPLHGPNINLVLNTTTTEEYQENLICNQGLGYSNNSLYTLKSTTPLNVPLPRSPKTVSFWASVDYGGSIDMTIYGEKIKITTDSIIIKPVNENHNFQKLYFGRMFRRNPSTAGTLNLYTINFNNDPTPDYTAVSDFYQSNAKTNPPYYPVDIRMTVNGQGLPAPFKLFANLTNNYPSTIETTHWAPYYTQGADLSNNEFSISFIRAKIDELLIYDQKIDPLMLWNEYKETIIDSTPSSRTASPPTNNEIFTVSPNPTTGTVTLNANIVFDDSDILITNTYGKEVYRSKLTSKNFDLPANLPEGIYILTLKTKESKVYSSKIILTR